jgi:hemerythrin-like domain-containing protein
MRVTITLLSYDHGILRQVMDVVGDMANRGELEKHKGLMPEVSDFFIKFMDEYHHGKEEKFVFPMADNGPERVRAMIPDLIVDHRKARSFADAIVSDVSNWNVEPLTQNCIDLVAHMREHIQEEENFVFPALEEIMDPDRDMAQFEKAQEFLKENFGEDYPAEMEKFANRLQEAVWGKEIRYNR